MRVIPGVLLSSAWILLSVGVALGQGTDPSMIGTSSGGGSNGTVDVPGPIDAQGEMQNATNPNTGPETSERLSAVRERARKASPKACAEVQEQLAEISRQVDGEANKQGDAVMARRIAPEFGLTAEAMAAEHSGLDAGWGELMITHTLMANSTNDLTSDQVLHLHREGLGWGQIAHGLDLRLGEVVAAMKAEGRVAMGRAKADGKPATIRSAARVAGNANPSAPVGSPSIGSASSMGVEGEVGK